MFCSNYSTKNMLKLLANISIPLFTFCSSNKNADNHFGFKNVAT